MKEPNGYAFTRIPRIDRGDIITAVYLNSIGSNLNQVTEVLSANFSEQIADGDQTAPRAQGPSEIVTDSRNPTTVPYNQIWVEKQRTTETVRVESPDDPDVYVDVSRIVIVLSSNLVGEEKMEIFDNSGVG